jgi:hypothetical protein
MDPRERLRDLSDRLLRLHKVLLDRERDAYEQQHGAVPAADLFRLVLHDGQFAWLRVLSGMIAEIDELVDADEPVGPENAQTVFGRAHRLLRAGDRGDFQDKYRAALQESPDVVMAHARVSRVLPTPPERP